MTELPLCVSSRQRGREERLATARAEARVDSTPLEIRWGAVRAPVWGVGLGMEGGSSHGKAEGQAEHLVAGWRGVWLCVPGIRTADTEKLLCARHWARGWEPGVG